MDLLHAKKSANRFHAAAVVLASHAMGLDADRVVKQRISLPLVVQEGGRIFVLNMGTTKQNDDFITPYVVNAAFSLELHLKILIQLESNEWITGHSLDTLFNKVSEKRRTSIRQNVANSLAESDFLQKALGSLASNGVKVDWEVGELLSRSSDAFEHWRYAFEASPGCFAGYSEIQNAITLQLAELESSSNAR